MSAASKVAPPDPSEIGRLIETTLVPERACRVAPFVNVIVPVVPAKILFTPIATVPSLNEELPVAMPVPESVSFPLPSLMMPPVPIEIVLPTVMSPTPPNVRFVFVPASVPEIVSRSASELIRDAVPSVMPPE